MKYLTLLVLLTFLQCGSDDLFHVEAKYWKESETWCFPKIALDNAHIVYGRFVNKLFDNIEKKYEISLNGMALGNFILLNKRYFNEEDDCKSSSILCHEAYHVSSYNEKGGGKYTDRYIKSYIINRLEEMDHKEAYHNVEEEKEAKDFEEEAKAQCYSEK